MAVGFHTDSPGEWLNGAPITARLSKAVWLLVRSRAASLRPDFNALHGAHFYVDMQLNIFR
jgi:hypothetical protein